MTVTKVGLFSQLLQVLPRHKFDDLVKKHQAQRCAKGFTCYMQLVAMLFCHLARAESLREICYGLLSCGGKLQHLGLKKAPARSTLSYANAHRPPELYRDLFFTLLEHLRAQGLLPRKHRFNFHNRLLSLDSTVISLSLRMFPWADFQHTKGGLKLHVLLDNSDYLPRYAYIGAAREHDINYARKLSLPPDSVVVMDKGYMDLQMLARWDAEGVYFVTPLKKEMCYRVLRQRRVPRGGAVLRDNLVQLTGIKGGERFGKPLRLVELEITDRDGQTRFLALLTNQLEFDTETIGEIYKERWQIELFFKALKQNLTLRQFVGVNENALKVQIWTALIAMLLLKWLYYKSHFNWSFTNLAATLRLNLFAYRNLQDFLDDPWMPPPDEQRPVQLTLQF
jgi:hypothetical protein